MSRCLDPMASRVAPSAGSWLLLAALLLVGCARLEFVGSTPSAGEVLSAGTPAIQVEFDDPLDPATVSAVQVVLTQGEERIPVRVGLGPSGSALLVEPLVPLRPGLEARLLVPEGVPGFGRRRSRAPIELRFPVARSTVAPAPMKSRSFQLQGGVGPATR